MSKNTGGEKTLRVGIIGAGLQGGRRARAIKQFPDSTVVMIADTRLNNAEKLASNLGSEATQYWQDIINNPDINVALVCTPPHLHAEMSIAAMKSHKHVLCEKPLTRTITEARVILDVAKENQVVLKCGFNHRHHPAINQAKQSIDAGVIGELNFIRCVYGIGGRPGYEKEWRADPKVVGGGQLMEQGIHAIDLFRWFLGEFSDVTGFVSNRFWKIEPLEDNAFALFRTAKGQVASLHSSLTQWKNHFTFELFGRDGYIAIEGLGGSYGTEKITVGKRAFHEPFKNETTEFRGNDISWAEEWKEFTSAIAEKREPLGNGADGLEAMQLVNAVYESARHGLTIRLGGYLD
jgi:predicted dehydrogenase